MKSRCPNNSEKVSRRSRGQNVARDMKSGTPSIIGISTGIVQDFDDNIGDISDEVPPLRLKDDKRNDDYLEVDMVNNNTSEEPVINKSWAEAHYKDDLWNMRFEALVKYGEEHGHCNCPHTYRFVFSFIISSHVNQYL